jgi:hypothetical protein
MMGEFVDGLHSGVGHVRFVAPSLRYRSLSACEFHACMDWRAEVRLFGVGGEFTSDDDVFGGYVDFLTLRLGKEHVVHVLDSLSGDPRGVPPRRFPETSDDQILWHTGQDEQRPALPRTAF